MYMYVPLQGVDFGLQASPSSNVNLGCGDLPPEKLL